MARSEGQTLLEVLCAHCALNPRAPRSVVQLSGAPGFPPSLSGTCGTCGVAYIATQTGRPIARPLALVYPVEAELRAYLAADADEPNRIGFVRTWPPRGEQPFRTPFGEGGEINK